MSRVNINLTYSALLAVATYDLNFHALVKRCTFVLVLSNCSDYCSLDYIPLRFCRGTLDMRPFASFKNLYDVLGIEKTASGDDGLPMQHL